MDGGEKVGGKQIAEIECEQNYGEDRNKESGHIAGRLGLKEEQHVNVEYNSERKAQQNQRLSLFLFLPFRVCEGCIFGFFCFIVKMRLGEDLWWGGDNEKLC